MDQQDIEMSDSDATDGANLSTDHNKPINLVDIEIQTYDDEYSPDLFDSSADLTTLTHTPKIGKEESSPHQPTVPTIPKSLIPFISIVNESWTSDLETPQAKTTAGINVQSNEISEQLSKSCKSVERNCCDTIRSSRFIPDVTTPSGCFVNRFENEGFSTSPILNIMNKRRRPKRRILKSLIDTPIQTEICKEITNVCLKSTDDHVSNDIENLESETTLIQDHTSSIKNTTFLIDESCLAKNDNIELTQDEINNGEMDLLTEAQSLIEKGQDSTLTVSEEEECLMNERLQSSEDFGEISFNHTLKNDEEKITRISESENTAIVDTAGDRSGVNETDESLTELIKEIRELEKNKKPVAEYKYADIPMDVFTRDAEALERADIIPMRPPSKSTVKKQWGLISFTQMCLLEKENCQNDDLGIEETEKSDLTIKNSPPPQEPQVDKLTTAKSVPLALQDDEDIFFDEGEEPVIDIDEFSPWFYQSNDIKSEIIDTTNTVENPTRENAQGVKSRSEISTKQKISNVVKKGSAAAANDGANIDQNTSSKETVSVDKKEKMGTNPPQLYSSMGFSTAGGKQIIINEEKIKQAVKSYDQIALQVAKDYDANMLRNKTLDHKTENEEKKEATIPQQSFSSMGFSTASGKPIKVTECKLKAAAKIYEEVAAQVGKLGDAAILRDKIGGRQMNNKENKATISRNSYGFSTPRGKLMKVSEDKLRDTEKMYKETNSTDNLRPPLDSIKVPMSRGIKRIREHDDIDSRQISKTNFSAGFKTASTRKPLTINETAMKRAKYQGGDISENQFLQNNDSTKERMNSVDTGKNESVIRNYDETYKADVKSKFPSGFKVKTKNTSNYEVPSKLQRFSSAACEKPNTIPNIDQLEQLESGNLSDAAPLDNLSNEIQGTDNAKDRTSRTLNQQEHSFRKHKIINGISNPVTSISTGFNTASSNPKKIPDQVSSIVRNFLEEEEEGSCKSGLLNRNTFAKKISNEASLNARSLFSKEENSCKSSTLNSEFIKVSEEAFVKAEKSFSKEQENNSPPNSLLKRNSSAMETPESSNNSESKTPALKSISEKISSDETPVGVSIFQTSKRIRFNSDLQARKLFGETGGESDEETEYAKEFNIESNKNPRTLLSNNSNYAQHLLSHQRNKNLSSSKNGIAGLYAKSEMFETNDRLGIPKLEAQKSSPFNQDTEIIIHGEGKLSKRLAQSQKDRRISTYSDEITASTEALLADEENSFDGKTWASAITCSPTLIEDRDISVKAITLGGDVIQEAPTSPIIGKKFRSRRKVKRNKRNLVKKDVVGPRSIKNNGCTVNEPLEEQIVTQDSQQSSGAATQVSDSSKESYKSMSTVIDSALVSNLNKIEETTATVLSVDNLSGNLEGLNSSEIKDREAIEDFLENRLAAILEQEKQIRAKKKRKPKPIPGCLFLRKTENRKLRISWREVVNGVPPTLRTSHELTSLGVRLEVMEITAATALGYKFKCIDFYSKDEIRGNSNGLEIGDGGRLILDENGYAGVAEFEQAFMASPGVDPTLLPQRWLENHYRWIVWKLASMDRTKFGDFCMSRMLTPRNVMEQLKYRYDREIDKSQRPALRRIIEKDDPPCRRMILCVSTITKLENIQALEKSPKMTPDSHLKVELTDGWYSVTATIDSAMAYLIAIGKVREGTKLVTCRAELLNCEQGCFPLEIPGEASLKIHTNSTRRTKWDAKLGYCNYSGPIPTLLPAILQYGGLIGKLITTIARVYPIQYFEKTSGGQSVFRNNKCEDKATMMYEKERQTQIDAIYAKARADFEARNRKHSKNYSSDNRGKSLKHSSDETGNNLTRDQWNDRDRDSDQQSYGTTEEDFRNKVESILRDSLPPPRKVTLVLKVRVMEGNNIAILTVWSPSEDIIDVIKEGNRVSIHNVQTSGKRLGELHLTAGHQSFVKPEKSIVSSFPQRCLTSIPEVAVAGFNPPFGEFDTVGIVVSLGPAPHGMKNFEVVNLACPNPEGSDSTYLSILFWEGIGAHGFSDILSVGATVACTNLQWRRGAPRTIPMAYSTEHSTFTRNPRQTYLRSAFDLVKNQITDLVTYVSRCASEIAIEHQKKPTTIRSPAVQETPSKAYPYAATSLQDKFTPGVSPRTPQGLVNQGGSTPAKYSIQRRLEKLQWYGEPPDLSPVSLNHSSMKVNQKFVPPARTPEHLECVNRRKEMNLKK